MNSPAEGPEGGYAAVGRLLDFERLDVYRVAIEFQVLLARLLPRKGFASIRDQLERASASAVLNIAEGAGRARATDKARFYVIARGSAMESAAALDVLLARGAIAPAEHRHARGLLVRVVQMLTKLTLGMHARG
jgi:four helix bundle protein